MWSEYEQEPAACWLEKKLATSWNFAKKMRTKDYEVAVKPAGLVNEPSEK